MAADYYAKLKLSTGQILQIGGIGTSIEELPEDATAEDLTENVFYSAPSELADSNEIFSIRVEPNDAASEPLDGQAVVFASPDNI